MICRLFVIILAERQALELILSQNIIKLQTTDNQVQITTQSKTKCF